MNPIGPTPEWMADAACTEVGDPDQFFPDKGHATRPARLVCARCGVRAECLQYALDNGERFGVWGGHSVEEREALGAARAPAEPIDEAAVARRVAGIIERGSLTYPEQAEVVLRLTAAGLSNNQIEARTGINVGRLRSLHPPRDMEASA